MQIANEIEGIIHTGKNKDSALVQRLQTVVDASVVRNLAPFQAIAFLNLEQRAMDDVINCQPVFDD